MGDLRLSIEEEGTTGNSFDEIMEIVWRMKDACSSGGGGGSEYEVEGCTGDESSRF